MEESERYFLLPGDIAFASRPSILSTLLGSCISICLYDRKLKIGGMNHYMLPEVGAAGMRLSKGKYGSYAIPKLVAMAERAGATRDNLVASIYGGGKVSGHLSSVGTTALYNVSERNALVAETLIKETGIKVVRRDTGGMWARKIRMETHTGDIELVRIEKSAENLERERKLHEFKKRRIRVLVVDDSRLVRRILCAAISSTDDMEVIGEAADPFEARERILQDDPDVISLDIIMPRMDGLTFLRKLMRYKYIPTVVVSTTAKEDSAMVKKVLDAGAICAVDKDALSIYNGTERLVREYLPKLRLAAATSAPQKADT